MPSSTSLFSFAFLWLLYFSRLTREVHLEYSEYQSVLTVHNRTGNENQKRNMQILSSKERGLSHSLEGY